MNRFTSVYVDINIWLEILTGLIDQNDINWNVYALKPALIAKEVNGCSNIACLKHKLNM